MRASPLTLAALLSVTACTGPVRALHVLPTARAHVPIPLCGPASGCDSTITVTYLGVGGFLIDARETGIMTAPSFTHPGLFRTLFGLSLHADTIRIDSLLAPFDLGRVQAILVGHSHYDHLLDVPFVARRLATEARILGTPTAKHLLAGDARLDTSRVIAFDSAATGNAQRVGAWYYLRRPTGAPRLRVMALESEHAPNFWRLTIAPWSASSDYDALPGTAWGWRRGEVYSYLIDVIRADSSTAFRLFYQDAAAGPRFNVLPPFTGRDRHTVDVAILCAGNYGQVGDYPTSVLETLHPRFALLGHWENFFRDVREAAGVVPLTDTEELERRMSVLPVERWASLAPFDSIAFRYSW